MTDTDRLITSDTAIRPPVQRRTALCAKRRHYCVAVGCLVLSACAQPEEIPLPEGTYKATCESHYGFKSCIEDVQKQCPDGYYTLDRISGYPDNRLLYRCGGT